MFIKKYTGIILLLVLVSLSLSTGCKKSSSDSSNPLGPQTGTNALVGTWVMTKMTVINPDSTTTDYTPQQAGLSITMIFRADNTAEITTTDMNGTSTDKGTYSFANNVITLKDTAGQTQNLPVTLNGNTLTARINVTSNGIETSTIVTFTKQPGIRWD